MVYVVVNKNELDQWEFVKYTSSTVGQRSLVSGYTIGDITKLDAEGRLTHGFWIQEDNYVGTGEFCEFEKKEVVMDDVEGKIINTYTYKPMDVAIVRAEMKQRVEAHRSYLATSEYVKDSNVFDLSSEGRLELQGLLIELLVDSSIESLSIRDKSGNDVVLSAAEIKALYLEISLYRDGLFDTEQEICSAIDAAQDYEAVRLAAKWGDVIL